MAPYGEKDNNRSLTDKTDSCRQWTAGISVNARYISADVNN